MKRLEGKVLRREGVHRFRRIVTGLDEQERRRGEEAKRRPLAPAREEGKAELGDNWDMPPKHSPVVRERIPRTRDNREIFPKGCPTAEIEKDRL